MSHVAEDEQASIKNSKEVEANTNAVAIHDLDYDVPPEELTPVSAVYYASLGGRGLSEKEFFSSDPGASSDDECTGDKGAGILKEEVSAPPEGFSQRLAAILVAGAGFLADSYDLFVINIVLIMMKQNESYGLLTPDMQTQCSFMAIIGAAVGQLLFGFLGDQYGRRRMFLLTAILTILGNILQATAQPRKRLGIYQQMMLFRFIMGIGVGGEYPTASIITSENSTNWTRGRNLAAVFSMQGVGRLLCAVVLLTCVRTIEDTNIQWRVAVIVGALPMMIAVFYRWLPETAAFRHQVQARYPNMRERFKVIWKTVWENRRALTGTAGSWFILDMLFYGNSLFSADVTARIGLGDNIRGLTVQNLIIQSMAMPGYILAVLFIDCIGKKRLQLIGFFGEGVIFAVMAVFHSRLKRMPQVFLVMYALTFLFDNFGANTSTFVIPAVIYPTEARSTCHGISAAFGKAGAVVGASVFLNIVTMHCPNHGCSEDVDPALVDRGIKTVFYWYVIFDGVLRFSMSFSWAADPPLIAYPCREIMHLFSSFPPPFPVPFLSTRCAILSLVGFLWTCILVHDKRHKSLDCNGPLQAPATSAEYRMT